MSQWRRMGSSGRLYRDPVVDFWQISRTVQDPSIPNLPLEDAAVSFPTQYPGLRFYDGGAVRSLCMVAVADAPAGDTPMVRKGGTTYAVYLVDTTDPNASSVRIGTGAGVKAIRMLT